MDDFGIVFSAVMNGYWEYYTPLDKNTRELIAMLIERCWQKTLIYSGVKKVIEKVIFNPPATIVFWSDKTKTVVKCGKNDIFDPEKGLALAIAKKLYGNNGGNYYNTFAKWLPDSKDKNNISDITLGDAIDNAVKTIYKLCDALGCENSKKIVEAIPEMTTSFDILKDVISEATE